MAPIDVINNKPARSKRQVIVRPMKQSGIDMFGLWLQEKDWSEVFEAQSVDEMTEIFQTTLLEKVEEI